MKRISFWGGVLTVSVLVACKPAMKDRASAEVAQVSPIMLVGSYADVAQEGVKAFRFEEDSVRATYLCGLSGLSNPSFLVPTKDGKHLYAVTEDAGQTAGAYAISFDAENGRMTLLNEVATQGGAPCHITLDPSERFVVTANYFGGNISIMAVDDSGRLKEPVCVIPFTGKSADPERQTKPYLHAVRFSPDGRFLLADDLGTDRIHIFPVNEKAVAGRPNSLVKPDGMTDVEVKPRNGPRHLVFHPNGRYAYLINELSGNVVVFDYADGKLATKQYLEADTLHAGGSADIQLSPDGRFLYASNRLKADGIAIFKIDAQDGTLTRIGYQPTGIHPRGFALTPSGRYLLAACRDSHCIQIFRRDEQTGLLMDTGQVVEMNKPVCIRFLERPVSPA